MIPNHKAAYIRIALFLSALEFVALVSAQTKPVPPAPVPNQILTAKKLFIANAGGDERSHEQPWFSGGVDRPYNQFYAAIKSEGRYELIGSPAEADVLFEIRFTLPTAEPVANRTATLATVAFDPQFRLEIRDPKTNALLWGFTEHVPWALLQGNRDKNFDQAVVRLVSDVDSLAARSPSAATPAQP